MDETNTRAAALASIRERGDNFGPQAWGALEPMKERAARTVIDRSRDGTPMAEEGVMSETPETWLESLFEYENCDECGGDGGDHEICIVPVTGTYFARCLGMPPKEAEDPIHERAEEIPIGMTRSC